jgi:hypothetical protein
MVDSHPLNAHLGSRKHPARGDARRTTKLTDCLNAPPDATMPLRTDSAWALRLKTAVDAVVHELGVEVLSAKAILAPSEDEMIFEMDTNRGRLQVVRLRGGKHEFRWMT